MFFPHPFLEGMERIFVILKRYINPFYPWKDDLNGVELVNHSVCGAAILLFFFSIVQHISKQHRKPANRVMASQHLWTFEIMDISLCMVSRASAD